VGRRSEAARGCRGRRRSDRRSHDRASRRGALARAFARDPAQLPEAAPRGGARQGRRARDHRRHRTPRAHPAGGGLDRHHRHQRKVDHDRPPRPHPLGHRPRRRGRRQSRHAGPLARGARARRALRPRDELLSAGAHGLHHLGRGDPPQHHARPSRPPRRDGGLHRREEAHLPSPDAAARGNRRRRRPDLPRHPRRAREDRRPGRDPDFRRRARAGRRLGGGRTAFRQWNAGAGARTRRAAPRQAQLAEHRRFMGGGEASRRPARADRRRDGDLSRPRAPAGDGRHDRRRAVDQRFQSDQRRRDGEGARLLRRHLVDRRRPAEGGRHRLARALLHAHPPCLSHRRGGRGFRPRLDGKVPWTISGTLANAVAAARAAARPGGVVLLSPACASFDQFANFEARGDAFRDLVRSSPQGEAREGTASRVQQSPPHPSRAERRQ